MMFSLVDYLRACAVAVYNFVFCSGRQNVPRRDLSIALPCFESTRRTCCKNYTVHFNDLFFVPPDLSMNSVESLVCKNIAHFQFPIVSPFTYTSLVTLDITQCGLKSIPEEIFGFTNLETLSLDDNEIEEIDEDIQKLDRLKYISLKGNNLGEDSLDLLSRLSGAFVQTPKLDMRHNPQISVERLKTFYEENARFQAPDDQNSRQWSLMIPIFSRVVEHFVEIFFEPDF
ncbi:MAG: leucine-rich repeat domain-containing protein [Chlamydiota bacterium]